MRVLTMSAGSKFEIDEVKYILTKVFDDGGFNWLGEDGQYKLSQHFYVAGLPTVEKVESMQKYLVV